MAKGITNRQMAFVFLLIITSFRTTDVPQLAAKTAGRSGWIIVLLLAIPYALVAMMIARLNTMYPGLTMFEYGQKILGKAIAYLFSILFAIYFFSVAVYLNQEFSMLISLNFLSRTPPFFPLAITAALYGYVVFKGTFTLARLFELLGVLYAITTLVLCVLLLTQSEMYNILPLYNPSEGKQMLASILKYVTLYGGIENLFLVPLNEQNRKAPKVAFFSILIIGLMFVFVTEGTIGMLGINNTIAYNDSFVQAIKLAQAPVIQRPDIIYLTFGLSSLFAGLIILLHSAVELIIRLIPMAKRFWVVLLVILAFYGATLYALKIPNFAEVSKMVLQYMVLFFAIVFPVTLYLLAKLKNRLPAKPERRKT